MEYLGTDPRTKRSLLALVVATLDSPPAKLSPAVAGHFALLLQSSAGTEPLSRSVARAWIESGAAFILCTGPAAEELEQTFDDATFRPELGPELPYTVMTTAHRDEPLESVLHFAFDQAEVAEDAPGDLQAVILITTSLPTVECSRLWLNARH